MATTYKRLNLSTAEADLLTGTLESKINSMTPTEADFEQFYTLYLKLKKAKPIKC